MYYTWEHIIGYYNSVTVSRYLTMLKSKLDDISPALSAYIYKEYKLE